MEDIKKQIADILKERRESAFENAQRDYEAARGDKDFARLDTQVRELTLEISFARSQGKTNKAADKKLKELESERGKWLEAHGLSITPRFICPVCGDTGVTGNGERCGCVKELFRTLVKTRSRGNLPPFTFADNRIASMQCSQGEKLDKAYSLLKKYSGEFPQSRIKCIILSGGVGTGKTCLMSAVGNALADRGFSVLYISAFRFNKKLLEYHTSDLTAKAHILDEFLNADMLMIDDLGTEQIYKNVTLEYMYDIFDTRFSEGKAVMITTNLTNDEILDRYGERIYSRLFNKNYSSFKRINGDDLRISGR